MDKWGALNILYYRTITPQSTGYAQIWACYARVTGLGTNHRTVFARHLSPSDFLSWTSPTGPNDNTLGDYQMICNSGCLVYACYVTTQDPSGAPAYCYYVQRINVCAADLDADGAVTVADVLAFGDAYIAGQPQADVNQDGQVNPYDVQAFLEAYTCGCGPQ